LRCIVASPNTDSARILCQRIWGLLLEVAEEDIEAGIKLVDEHCSKPDSPFFSLDLHETPELGYRLAVIFQPRRPEFAIPLLCDAIQYSSFQLKKLDAAGADALQEIMDASCRLLASWTLDTSEAAPAVRLRALDSLFWYGNPADPYWQQLPARSLELLRGLTPAEQRQQLRLLAQPAFYADSGSPVEREALALFQTSVEYAIGSVRAWDDQMRSAIDDACGALSILEDKTSSYRNRHIAANLAHPLLSIIEACVRNVRDGVLPIKPEAALSASVSLAVSLSNEKLIRRQHQFLRQEFEQRASQFPADAGRALEELIKYCHYSQSNDEIYRTEICKESFDLLLPILVRISPPDADIARAAIGWNPRDAYM
jgi:hypothetical protein